MEIENKFERELPLEYIDFLKVNPEGDEIAFNEYNEEDTEFEGRYWNIFGEAELLESWEMYGVGSAKNYECLKLFISLQKEFSEKNWASSNIGKIELTRIEKGFVIGVENGDYLYLDPFDNFSVWIYYHDGGNVLKVADSFLEFREA